jgi:hypothetical protein
VLRTGTPTAGQIAKWTDASHIQGVTVAGPQITVLTSGSGTFTTPAGAIWLEVEMNGGGGGGNNGDNGNAGAAGTGSTFGGSLATGGGGLSGGSATGGDINITGGSKPVIGGRSDGTLTTPGANGANSPFCGAGGGGGFGYAAGLAASANSGSGGGGGSVIAAGGFGGLGGSAGGYLRKLITSPLATYAYTVGAGGNGGAETSGCWAGGNGGSGVIIVTAHFGA